MLTVSFFELIARGLPESLLFVYSVHLLTYTKINVKKYFISSILLDVIGFLIRRLPINYGIHTMLNIMVLVILTTYINKIYILKCIKAGILTAVIMFMCEGINMTIIQLLYNHDNIVRIFNDYILKTLYGLPSLIIFMVSILIIKFLIYRKRKKENV